MPEPYYRDDAVTLYCGDCREVDAWLTADVLVTDPPYGVQYRGHGANVAPNYAVANDQDFATAAQVIRMARHLPMAVFANHASLPETLAAVRTAHKRTRTAVWHKTNINGGAPGNPWLADVEFAVCGVPAWPGVPRSGLISARRFTGNPACNASPDAYLHPTQKPIPVMESVLDILPPGVIADPFAGSGSTLIAARNLGRRAVGVEVDEAYCETIARRLAQGAFDFGVA
jgi:DNA modification methylase